MLNNCIGRVAIAAATLILSTLICPESRACTLYLQTKVYFVPEFSTGAPSMIPHYFFGSDPQTLTPLNYFGTNLSAAVRDVPEAYKAARTYTAFRIASLVGIFGGFGFTVGNMIYQAQKGIQYQERTGKPGSFNPVPFFAGLGFMAGGVVVHFGRHVPIHVAVSAFNRSGIEGKCLYLDAGYY
jgi:hypothetical protein